VAFTPDGSAIVTCSKSIRVWDASPCTSEAKKAAARMAEQEAEAWHRREAAACKRESPPQTFGWLFHTWHAWMCRPSESLQSGDGD
jgi:hypothetical protein